MDFFSLRVEEKEGMEGFLPYFIQKAPMASMGFCQLRALSKVQTKVWPWVLRIRVPVLAHHPLPTGRYGVKDHVVRRRGQANAAGIR